MVIIDEAVDIPPELWDSLRHRVEKMNALVVIQTPIGDSDWLWNYSSPCVDPFKYGYVGSTDISSN